MALPAATVFEVRTAGSDVSSGGFVAGAAGADFSQQDAKNTTSQGTTTLSGNGGSITSGATTCIVASATALYGAAQALLGVNAIVGDWLQIDSEIVKVTARSTNTLTITRAQLGTSAASHNDGATVTNVSNVSVTDVVTAGTTTLTSLTAYWSANLVGNLIYVAGGTATLTGVWKQVVSVSTSGSSTTMVVDSSTGLTTGTGATGNVGGALASPGQAGALRVIGNTVWIKSGTYLITSASTNTSGGCVSDATGGAVKTWEGYNASRGDLGTAPLLQASGISTATLFAVTTGSTAGSILRNITVDGAGLTSIQGFNFARRSLGYKLKALNCTNIGFNLAANNYLVFCSATNITGGTAAFVGGLCVFCEAYSNTVSGFSLSGNTVQVYCLSYGNTGSTSDGFVTSAAPIHFIGCVAYGNGRDGFRATTTSEPQIFTNCIAERNGVTAKGAGFNVSSAAIGAVTVLVNCAVFGNTTNSSVNISANITGPQIGTVTGNASFFVDAAHGNFALNNTAGAGASCRAAGIPGTYPTGTTVGYLDIGAAQHQDPTSGTGSIFSSPVIRAN